MTSFSVGRPVEDMGAKVYHLIMGFMVHVLAQCTTLTDGPKNSQTDTVLVVAIVETPPTFRLETKTYCVIRVRHESFLCCPQRRPSVSPSED